MDKYKYNRYSIRLTEYDYSKSGYYFITLVTQDREKLFGTIQNKKMKLNDVGRMIDMQWNKIPKRFKNAVLDKHIIMPDHFHGIIQIIPTPNKNNVGTPLVGIQPEKLNVHNKNPYVQPEKLPVYNKSPFVKTHDICSGSQDDYIKMRNVYGGLQSTGTSPEPAGKYTGKTTLFDIIGAFKSITTNMYINGVKNNNWPRFNKRLWQLRFHDRIIRTENELNRIREYIIENPVNYYSHTK